MDISNQSQYSLYIPKTGARFLITGNRAGDQVGRNDFETNVQESKMLCPGFFVICAATERTPLYVSARSHLFVFHDYASREKLSAVLKLRIINFLLFIMFVGEGKIRNSGCGWMGRYNLWYHLYVLPYNNELLDGVHSNYPKELRKEREQHDCLWSDKCWQHHLQKGKLQVKVRKERYGDRAWFYGWVGGIGFF